MKQIYEISCVENSWQEILSYTSSTWNQSNLNNLARKVLLTGFVYYFWLDRNNNLFNNVGRGQRRILRTLFANIWAKISYLIATTKMDPTVLCIMNS